MAGAIDRLDQLRRARRAAVASMRQTMRRAWDRIRLSGRLAR
jgi:hypothetical protein